MPKNSVEKLLSKFPYFLDKRPVSNFYKSQYVTNEQFKDIYQSLYDVIESFQLDKRLCIWKVQNEPYIYTINFFASYVHIKTVKCYKNDELIHMEYYEDTEEITSFFYSYDFPQENDDFEKIIPDDKFRIEVETYDELLLSKGFPEKDEPTYIENDDGEEEAVYDEYDHDYSLDEIGALHNIPRKKYIPTLNYSKTEPPFNDRLTEDDYHYMNRIFNYLLLIHSAPLPVAEIWKLYSLDAQMLNRERLLIKIFDITKHPYDKSTGKVKEWEKQAWEHKDGFCKKSEDSILFFVTASNLRPEKHRDVEFYFQFFNSFAETLQDEILIDIYYAGEQNPLETDYTDSVYHVDSSFLDDTDVNTFTFVAKQSDGTIIDSISMDIVVKGCNEGDFYVKADGDDNNDGTKDNPFKTITKAISKLSSTQDLIVVLGEIGLDKLNTISSPCTIMGCSNAKIHSNLNHNKFFQVSKNNKLTLIDLDLSHNYAISNFYLEDYLNKNEDANTLEDVIIHGGTPILTLNTPKNSFYHTYDNVHLTGSLLNRQENPIPDTVLDLYIGSELVKSLTTDSDGLIDEWLHYENLNLNQTLTYCLKFNGSDVFYQTDTSREISFSKETPSTSIRYGRLLTITSSDNNPGETIYLYEKVGNGLERVKTGVSNENGVVSFTFLPDYGENLFIFSEDGKNIKKEDTVDVRFHISDLNTKYLLTDISINNEGKLYINKTALTDFTTLGDLEDVITDLRIDDDGKFYKTTFKSNNPNLLNGNEIYPNDLELIKNAITNVTLSNEGLLEVERINIVMEEEQ